MSKLINRDKAQKIFYSNNEFSLLNSNIQTFFGEKYQFFNTIARYENYQEFGSREPIQNVEDIPEISNIDIYQLIQEEKHYKDKALKLLKEYSQYNEMDKMPEDKIIYFAQELGLYPKDKISYINVLTDARYNELKNYKNYNYDSLYPDLLLFHLMNKEDLEEYKNKFHNNIQQKTLMFHYLFEKIEENFLHILSDGRACIEFGYSRYFFRGENAFYGSSKAGLFRGKEVDNFDILISVIKMLELFRVYEEINLEHAGIDIYGSALAQHYSLPTHCLDFTSDLKVALFFACCKYNREQKKYFPLTKEDFKYKDSRKSIYERGGDSRFGLIFRVPSDFIFMSNSIPDGPYKQIHSIGYQPFLRSENQKGYIVETHKEYNLYNDYSFEKFKFRLNEDICNWIYKEMDSGKKLFPEEMFSEIDDLIEDINKLEEFDTTSLNYVYENYKIILGDISLDEFQEIIEKKGHKCIENKKWCSAERLKELQDKWKGKFNLKKFLDFKFRPVFYL